MRSDRPQVSPEVMAAIIAAAPDRVRRRLDRNPQAADQWDWQPSPHGWTVNTGSETATLPPEQIRSVDQLRCTCLLSANCFHVLACLASLEVAAAADGPDGASEPKKTTGTPAGPPAEEHETREHEKGAAEEDQQQPLVQPGEKQLRAARELEAAMAQVLGAGAANAGLVVQSAVLRAVHQCRAEGLHRAAAIGLRVLAGIRQLRARAPQSDPDQPADDIAAALETVRHVLGGQPVPRFWIGTARRPYGPAGSTGCWPNRSSRAAATPGPQCICSAKTIASTPSRMSGPTLLFDLADGAGLIRLAVANEDPSLYFRTNLRMLSHAPGLRLRVIGRMDLEEPAIVYGLAVAPAAPEDEDPTRPRLELPARLDGRVCLGCDELQRTDLVGVQAAPVAIEEGTVPESEDPLAALRRRWIAVMLAGSTARRQSTAGNAAAEIARLHRQGFPTAAGLLDALLRPTGPNAPTEPDTFLAVALYLRHARSRLAQTRCELAPTAGP